LEVRVDIWLAPGNHFWFACDETLAEEVEEVEAEESVEGEEGVEEDTGDGQADDQMEQEDAPADSDGDPSRLLQALCRRKGLKRFVPTTDNISLFIRGIQAGDTDEANAANELLPGEWRWLADETDTTDHSESGMAVVYVNQNDNYFNITKRAEFHNLIFDGIN